MSNDRARGIPGWNERLAGDFAPSPSQLLHAARKVCAPTPRYD
jgi:hypothetical protein